jgi:hypothetical protein
MTSMLTNAVLTEGFPTYVYIAGRGHSGSTLLTLLLARQPGIAAAGELSLLSLQIFRDEETRWIGQCSCGARPLECAIWGPILREIEREEGADFEARPFLWRISDVGLEEELRGSAPIRVPLIWLRNRLWRVLRYLQYRSPRVFGRLLSWYRPQVQWARRRGKLATKLALALGVEAIVDASKDPLDMLDLYHYSALPTKVVFLTRDVRGNTWSVLRRLKHGQSRADAVVSAAKEWRKVNGRIWRVFKGIPATDRLHLRYEDICRDPDAILKRLLDFLGLEPAKGARPGGQGGLASTAVHTIGGNRIRFNDEPLQIREDNAWQGKLTADELVVIDRLTSHLSRQLGHQAWSIT